MLKAGKSGLAMTGIWFNHGPYQDGCRRGVQGPMIIRSRRDVGGTAGLDGHGSCVGSLDRRRCYDDELAVSKWSGGSLLAVNLTEVFQ